jgi:hypothetical protein
MSSPALTKPSSLPPPLPSSIARVVSPLAKTVKTTEPAQDVQGVREQPLPSEPVPASKTIPRLERVVPEARVAQAEAGSELPKEKDSFEFRLGQVWLIRLAVLLGLTGLIFLGNEAYRHFVIKLSPMAKAMGLYAVSGALIGLGFFLERWKESLKYFAQVILAGGFAATYYVTYASHFVAPLRWIENVAVVALLMLGCAGVMTWVADLKKSQTLGTIGLLLAYYSSVLNPISWFTLLSNLLLSIAAMVLLLRNLWTLCAWLALPVTYGAFAYGHFFKFSDLSAGSITGFWLGAWFLFIYWLLFTAAVFLSRQGQMQDEGKAGFLCLNNLAFYGLVALIMTAEQREHLWAFTMGFGVLLTGLGVGAKVKNVLGTVASHAFIIKGLILITAGLFLKFSGYQLALLISIQSSVLLLAARGSLGGFLKVSSGLAAFLSLVVGMDVLMGQGYTAVSTGLLMTGLFVFQAWWSRNQLGQGLREGELRLASLYYVMLGVVASLTLSLVQLPFLYRASFLAGLAVLLSVLATRVRLPELALGALFFLMTSFGVWIIQGFENTLPWGHLLVLMGSALGLSYWWQQQKKIRVDQALVQVGIFFATFLSMVVFYLWLEPRWSSSEWMMYGGPLALVGVLYAIVFRNWAMGLFSQFFLVMSVSHFLVQVTHGPASWLLALVPVASVLAMNLCLQGLCQRRDSEPGGGWPLQILSPTVLLYRLLTLGMVLCWIQSYIPDIYLPGFLGLMALVAGAWGMREKNVLRIWFAFFLVVLGLLYFVFDSTRVIVTRWTDLVVILAPAVLQQLFKVWPVSAARFREMQVAGILMSIGGIWLFLARWVGQVSDGFYLTAGWTTLALGVFVTGLLLKERIYRLSGLFILACCLGRIVFVDIWQFGTLSRIVSLLVAAVVLGLMGFFYNRYAETIKKYL